MINESLLFSLELCILTVLVGLGIWRIYRSLRSVTINAPGSIAVLAAFVPPAYDMRQDGQQLSA